MMRLVLAALPRSGTNWVQDIVGNAPNVLACREILGPRAMEHVAAAGPVGAGALSRIGAPARDTADPALEAWLRADPLRLVALWEEVARAADTPALSFTLFPHHARGPLLGHIVARSGTYVVSLMRRQLPRYVSYVKARDANVWKRADTSGLHPVFKLDEFVRECRHAARWFARIAALPPPVRKRRLAYEDDLDRGVDLALERVRLAVPWLDLPTEASALRTTFARQDARGPVFERFVGGAAFAEALQALGLGEAALAYPDDPVWRAEAVEAVRARA